jgi:hypothetical protein
MKTISFSMLLCLAGCAGQHATTSNSVGNWSVGYGQTIVTSNQFVNRGNANDTAVGGSEGQ